jgi:predicted nucleotidyltransferase
VAEEAIARVIDHFAEALRRSGLRVARLVLFGSQARGTATADSDIDLAVVSEDFRGKDIFDRARAIKQAEVDTVKRFRVALDIVMFTPDEFESGSSPLPSFVREGEADGEGPA